MRSELDIDFKKITINDRQLFKEVCKEFPPYSDFNILSILSWDHDASASYFMLNNNLVIKIKDYLGEGYMFSVLGDKDIDSTLKILLEKFSQLSFVPEVVVNSINNPDQFHIEEDRDNFDYILNCKGITHLEGHSFKHLREDVHKFEKLYPGSYSALINLNNENTVKQITAITEKWYSYKHFDKSKIEEEQTMLSNFLTYSKYFETVFVGLYIEEKLIGYILNEIVDSSTVISHFGVSDKDFELSAYMLEFATARYLYDHGYTYQNQEQDAGLPGLRTAKMFYNPEFFLKKYKIRLK